MRWPLIACLVGCNYSPLRVDPSTDADPIGDATTTADAPPAIVCPTRYDIKFAQHSYSVVDGLVSWDEAKAECGTDGGTLIKIDSAAENTEVYMRMNDSSVPRLWIGLRDNNNDGTYEWPDGSTPTFTNFDSPPSPTSGDCVYIGGDTLVNEGGRWYTDNCNTNRFAVCECPGI